MFVKNRLIYLISMLKGNIICQMWIFIHLNLEIGNIASGCWASSLFAANLAPWYAHMWIAYQSRTGQYVILHVVQFSILIAQRPKLSPRFCPIPIPRWSKYLQSNVAYNATFYSTSIGDIYVTPAPPIFANENFNGNYSYFRYACVMRELASE